MKKVLNVFGILLALLFSLALVPLLIANPAFHAVSDFLQPETVEQVAVETIAQLDQVDLGEVIQNHPPLTEFLTELGLTPEAAQALVGSQAVQEVLTTLVGDAAQILRGSFTASTLTPAELQRIAAENRAELISILRLAAPSEMAALTDEQAGQAVDTLVQEYALPLLAELDGALLDAQAQLQEYLLGLRSLLPLGKAGLLIAALVLAFLIFLCRWPQQKGLLWLGIDCALAGLPLFGIAFSLKRSQISQLFAQATGLPNIFGPALQRFGTTMLIGSLILLAAAAVLIAGFVLLRDRRMRKQATHSDYAPDYAPAVPVAAEAPAITDTAERSPWDNV